MDGYVWYVIMRSKDGKNYAHAFRLRRNENLVPFIQNYPDIVTMNPCSTKEYARGLVQAWNESFKENGTYMFAD